MGKLVSEKRRCKKVERKTMALALVMLIVFTMIGALTATSLAAETTVDTTADVENQTCEWPFLVMPEMMLGEQGFGGGQGYRGGVPGGIRNIEVSTEYNETVNAILEADSDMKALIAEGYNVTSIRPVIKNVVEADGTISTKATTAVVTLQNSTSGIAVADVDISQAKVTEIVIFTRTVIDKTGS